jgi:hypothetical protein
VFLIRELSVARDPTVSFSPSVSGSLVRAPSPPGATHRATLRLATTVPRLCHKGTVPTASPVRSPRPRSPLSEAVPPPHCPNMPHRLTAHPRAVGRCTHSFPPPHSLLFSLLAGRRRRVTAGEREPKPPSSSESVSRHPPSLMQGVAASYHTPSFPPPLMPLLPRAQVTEPWPEPSSAARLPFVVGRLRPPGPRRRYLG